MSSHNNLVMLNLLRSKGVAVCKTPSGIVAYGLSRLSQSDREMFNRMTQTELLVALRMQKA